jgi:hypothetical protein
MHHLSWLMCSRRPRSSGPKYEIIRSNTSISGKTPSSSFSLSKSNLSTAKMHCKEASNQRRSSNPDFTEFVGSTYQHSKREYIRFLADVNSRLCFRPAPHDVANLDPSNVSSVYDFGSVVGVGQIDPLDVGLTFCANPILDHNVVWFTSVSSALA